jgi:hypothetical protein
MNLNPVFTGAILATFLSSCVYRHSKLDDTSTYPPSGWHLSRVIDHEKDAWNSAGVWRRISSTPPSFVPADFPRHASPAKHGELWVVDENDGWRFFVPVGGTPRYSEGLLLGEARKVTNDMPASSHRKRNVLTSVFVWPVLSILTMPATLMECLGCEPTDP